MKVEGEYQKRWVSDGDEVSEGVLQKFKFVVFFVVKI